MGKAFLVNLIALLMIAAIAYATINYVDEDKVENDERRLGKVIDNATEGALTTILLTGNVTSDYDRVSDLNIDPYIALEAFASNVLTSYGMADTLENRMGFKLDNVPVFVVALSNGYYIASIQQSKATTDGTKRFDLVFSPKKAYTYKASNGIIYSLGMNGEYHYAVATNGETFYTKGPAPGLDVDKTNLHITKHITSDIKGTIDSYMETNNSGWISNFYLPEEISEMDYKETNLIEGPSIIALVQNVNFGFKRPIDMVSVAGNKINLNRGIVGYSRNGIRYYTFSDKLPAGTTVSEVFDNMKEAAEKGYTPDIKTME